MDIKNINGVIPSPYDNRDYKFSDLLPMMAGSRLPKSFEAPLTPFIYDQGSSNMCAACSYNTVRFLQESNMRSGGSGINVPFSPAFTYANRIDGEEFEGMYLRSVCKKGKEGSIPYNVLPGFYSYPECKSLFLRNKKEYLEMAKPFAITSYYQCNDRESVKRAIVECGAVIGGIWVYDCIFNPDEGFIKYDPKNNVENYGGHAIVICGYKEFNGKLYWRIQNSWGVTWGDKGRAWLPEEYPWIESPWAIIDYNVELKWEEYVKQHNL